MGLFRKKSDPEELALLRDEISSLRERLNAADTQKAELLAKVDTVDQTNAVLYQRIDTLDATSATLDERVSQVDAARNDLSHQVGSVGELSEQVHELAERLTTAKPAVPPPPPSAAADPRVDDLTSRVETLAAAMTDPTQPVDTAAVTELTERLDRLAATLAEQSERLDNVTPGSGAAESADGTDAADVEALRSQMSLMAEKMSALDMRMTNVSTELANQLTELSNDLDVLLEQDRTDRGGDDESGEHSEAVTSALANVQKSTERLAAEQARYEIQFREDLAELADRLRRPSAR